MSGSFGSTVLAAGNNYSGSIDSGTVGGDAFDGTAVLVSCDAGLTFTGQGSLQIFLQDSADGVTFTDYRMISPPLVFASLPAGAFAGANIRVAMRRYWRMRYLVAGTNPVGSVSGSLAAYSPDKRYPFSFEVL